ncbi:MAG: hypothetical protein Kow0092_38920 [Deferrisomatales bacterium]
MDTHRILEHLYPGGAATARRLGRARARWGVFSEWVRARGWYLLTALLAATLWLAAHLYYYNVLVDMEYNVLEAWAQVEAQMERRHHIQENLALIMADYSRYERDVLTRLTELRAGSVAGGEPPASQTQGAAPAAPAEAPAAPPDGVSPEALRGALAAAAPGQVDEALRQIRLVAEQYPQLKLTENFQQFTAAIIENENKITDAIVRYNQVVNDYTTYLGQFPANLFGKILGFKYRDFYVPDRKFLGFKKVDY